MSYRNPKTFKYKLRGMQILHGKIKGLNYPKSNNIMELGAGKLNDLLNWTNKGIKKVYAIEIDKDSIEIGKKKYLKYKERNIDLPEIIYIQADLTKSEDINKIKETLINMKGIIDHVICNFSIHYFLRNKKTTHSIIKLTEQDLAELKA